MTRDAKWWKKEIKKKAKSLFDNLIYMLIILLLLMLLYGGYIYVYRPKGGSVFGFEIKEHVARLITYIIGSISVIGITLSGVCRLKRKRFARYLHAALDIINNLADVAGDIKTEMRDIVNSELECCTDPHKKKECSEALKECCKKLSTFSITIT